MLPNGSWAEPVNSKGTVTGLVTPLMVRSPVTAQSSPSRSTLVETNVMDGWVATSKQSSLARWQSEEHTSELQSLMRISYAVFCLKKKTPTNASHQQKK